MDSVGSNSSSLLLFDHSIKNTVFEGRNGGDSGWPPANETLFSSTAGTGASTSSYNPDPDTNTTIPPSNTLCPPSTAPLYTRCSYYTNFGSNFQTYLFFIFPIIGGLTLLIGTCILRKRQVRQDAEAIQRDRDRLNRAEVERILKEERRTKLVEKSLVTTKVTFMTGKKKSHITRCATMDTVEYDGDSFDLDSTNSSSASIALGKGRRTSELSSDDGNEQEKETKELNKAEQGQASSIDVTSDHDVDNNINDSPNADADVSTTEIETDGNDDPKEDTKNTSSLDWQTETCAICLEPYKENDDVSYSKHQNCTHAFHTSCILAWLKDELRNDCPCCRGPYLHLCVVEDEGDYNLGGGGIIVSTGASDSSSTIENGNSLMERITNENNNVEIPHAVDPAASESATAATSGNNATDYVETGDLNV